MNKKIRSMIDEVFSEMKMTPENLALRDELMANAIARYEDSLAEGKTEEEAFKEVAASLEDVHATLLEMDAAAEAAEEEAKAEADEDAADENDIGQTFEKAFAAIGDFGKQILPQMGKLAQQADEATGNVFSGFGKAVERGAVEVGRFAGETFEKIARNIQNSTAKKELTADELLARAKEIRIQAEIKQEADDQEGARVLRRKAYEMEMQAEAIRQSEEIEKARAAAEAEAAKEAEQEEVIVDITLDEVDADAISQEIEDILDEVEGSIREAGSDDDTAFEEGIHIEEPTADVVVINRFAPEGIHQIEVCVDADDVVFEPSDTGEIVVIWDAGDKPVSQPEARIEGDTLKVSRTNPDIFKTFLSVFKKEGGRITVKTPSDVPLAITGSTTSGNLKIGGVDTSEIKLNTTSGKVNIHLDVQKPAKAITVNTVSGKATVFAVAQQLSVTTVSGRLKAEGAADMADLNTVSGAISAHGAFKAYDVDTVSGDVHVICSDSPSGKVRIGTVSGSARLELPADVHGFTVESSSMSGSVMNQFGVNRYGTCEFPIHFESLSGKLSIIKKDE